MNGLVANYRRIHELADGIAHLVADLELGDLHYLRQNIYEDTSGASNVSDACDEFEKEWSFGRDRLSSSLRRLFEYLQSAANAYEEADLQNAIHLLGGPPGRSPSEKSSDWWKSLTREQQEALILDRPQAIGNMEGLPPEVRYRANAISIQEHIKVLKYSGGDRKRIAELERYLKPDPLLELKIEELRKAGASPETIARLEHLRANQRSGNPPRQILVFDPDGDGRIAEVHGSLTTADNVVVFVPGIGNDLANFDTATNSYGQNLYGAGRGDTAVVAWMGYDSPSGVEPDAATDLTAATPGRARSEADELKSFTKGLSTTVRGSVTVAAHSYGTVLTTIAAQNGMAVDKIILIGDPGVPASNVSEYNGAEVFAIRNEGDLIGLPTVHGSNPASGDFGATVLQGNSIEFEDRLHKAMLGPAVPGLALGMEFVDGLGKHHSSYFEPESTAIVSIMSAAESDR